MVYPFMTGTHNTKEYYSLPVPDGNSQHKGILRIVYPFMTGTHNTKEYYSLPDHDGNSQHKIIV